MRSLTSGKYFSSVYLQSFQSRVISRNVKRNYWPHHSDDGGTNRVPVKSRSITAQGRVVGTLTDEHRTRCLKTECWGTYIEKTSEKTDWKNYILRNFTSLAPIGSWVRKFEVLHARQKGENFEWRHNLEELDVSWKTMLKQMFEK
jgi:hypothetical protein